MSAWPADANKSDCQVDEQRTSEPDILPSGRTNEQERLPTKQTSEPGVTVERTNKRTERTSQTRMTPNPFDNYSERRRKRFCINSDNMKLRFYYTFFDEMGINNFLKRQLAFSLISRRRQVVDFPTRYDAILDLIIGRQTTVRSGHRLL